MPIKQKKGFTLLELLLVIVILGMLATFFIAMYQRNSVSFKVEKTALQMQAIMQAAAAYYADNNCWPNTTAGNQSQICPAKTPITTGNCNTSTPPSFDNYLPVGLKTTPWPATNNHYWCQPTPTSGNIIGKKFQVITAELPSLNLAQQLAAQLPSTTITVTTPFLATTEMALPNASPQKYWIAKIGFTGNYVDRNTIGPIIFSCPNQWNGTAVIFVRSFSNFQRYSSGGCTTHTAVYPPYYQIPYCNNNNQTVGIGVLNAQPLSCTQNDPGINQWRCISPNLNFYSNTPNKDNPYSPQVQVSTGVVNYGYIAWCNPPNTAASPIF